jgi:DnaJ-class molecular chaperone
MSVCMGGSDVRNCPEWPCAGCQRTFIYPPKQAVKCPVCEGSGQLPMFDAYSTAVNATKTCHGCGGKGWVTP